MGFDTERLAMKGRLAEQEAEARRLEMSIEGDVSAVRSLLPPFARVVELQAQQAAVQCVEMAAKHAEYLGLIAEIANIKRALGLT
jgi:hypothetical protein